MLDYITLSHILVNCCSWLDKARSEKEKHAGTFMCEYCSKTFDQHGWISTLP